jgi:4-diphosphocytidyl-2-C-methyl-D-erythritol kinase
LPIASGIGGGSSDAAAALRALARHWNLAPGDVRLAEAAARHGQDVPACLAIENNYLTAEGTALAPDLPHADCVLVNPGKGLSTPAVYKAYRESGNAFSPHAQLQAAPEDFTALVAALATRRNDLFEPACSLMPEIRDVIAALEKSGCGFARMSGSGATCFALYADRAAARSAASALLTAHPGWWVAQASIPFLRRGKDHEF